MVKDTKLYDLLGVKPTADDNEIKKGYRKSALKYHPDKPTGDTEKFKEISEAFDILSNPEKRSMYDTYGLEAARRGGISPEDAAGAAGGGAGAGGFPGGFPGAAGGGFPGGTYFSTSGGPGGGTQTFSFGGPGGGYTPFSSGDAFNIFQSFAESGGLDGEEDDIFSSLFGRAGGRRRAGGGGNKFKAGGGTGANGFRGGVPGSFPGMNGSAHASRSPEREPFTLQLPVSLEDLAKGTTKKMKIRRKAANGQTEEKILQVVIKPGWKSGTKITYNNEGDKYPDGSSQDVVFVISEKPHDKYKRKDNDLEMTLELSLKEALCGFSRIVDTIDGKKIKVEYTKPIQPGHVIRYPGHGMPISKQPGKRGDLVITIKVNFPSSLTPQQKQAIETNF